MLYPHIGEDRNDMVWNQQYVRNMTIGRPQSPELEYAFQDEVVRVLKALLETKSLYQNLRVAEGLFENYADAEYPTERLIAEFKKRPMYFHSRNEGSRPRSTSPLATHGTDPLGTPDDQISAGAYLPTINLECRNCKTTTSFLSMFASGSQCGPHSIIGEETEQIYSLSYSCADCRKALIVFQVLRKGLKLQLTGRSTPYRPSLSPDWPTEIGEIVRDAQASVAEGDVPAGYYHLRTALEFYLKMELGFALEDKVDGSELCDKYYGHVDSRLKTGFPSIATVYAELSTGLHSRQVNADRFNQLVGSLLDHLRAKKLFETYVTTS